MSVTATTQANALAQAQTGKEPVRPAQADGKPLPSGGSTPPLEHTKPPPPGIERAVKQIQEFLRDSNRQLMFERDQGSGKTVIKVIDPASGEVIRQFPPEALLKIAANVESQGFHTFDELA